MLVAIDGPAGAGKSTVARAVADRLGFTYLDTGAMYRCVALAALRVSDTGGELGEPASWGNLASRASIRFPNHDGSVELDGEDVTEAIRSPEVTDAASRISADSGVRRALVAAQRELIAEGDWVADGRDVGTVIAPDADVKIFLTASAEERARRRTAQQRESGMPVAYEDVLAEQRERDDRDATRDDSPLVRAPDAVELDTTGLTFDEVVDRVLNLVRLRQKGSGVRLLRSPLPCIAVVGLPNSGKSSLVNRIAGGREAVVDHRPGATRDRREQRAHWRDLDFTLVDTGGIATGEADEMTSLVRDQAQIAMDVADAVIVVCDGDEPLRPSDHELAELVRRQRAPAVLAVNKVDNPDDHSTAAEFNRLGLGEPVAVSAIHGIGVGDLLDRAYELIEGAPSAVPGEETETEGVKIAVVGRPNVGKSSLVNAWLGESRVIVAGAPGTTRDSIDTAIDVAGRRATLIDTAGLRRRGKVAGTVDFYAQLRSERAVERSDVAVLVCDAAVGVTAEDLRIGDLAMRSKCATLVALNKWDARAIELEDASHFVARKLRLRPLVMPVSAKTGRGVRRLLLEALELSDRAAMRVPTPQLNRAVKEIQERRQPPARRGRRLRMYYAAQIGSSPVKMAVQVNDPGLVTRDYGFFVENSLRDRFGFSGVPLVIDFVERSRPKRVGRQAGR